MPPVQFNQAPLYQLDDNPNDVAAADFNGDGKFDLGIGFSGIGQNGLGFLPGNDGDGKHDLALSQFGSVQLWLGEGNATFRLASSTSTFADDYGDAEIGDLNADGNLDLVRLPRGISIVMANWIWPQPLAL